MTYQIYFHQEQSSHELYNLIHVYNAHVSPQVQQHSSPHAIEIPHIIIPDRIFLCMRLLHSLVPRPPPFFVLWFAFSIIHGSGRASEKRGRPGLIHHVNDVRRT